MRNMQPSDCEMHEKAAEGLAKRGKNLKATELFHIAADCWIKWESFSRAAQAYERAYEHAMLACEYAEAALMMMRSSLVNVA